MVRIPSVEILRVIHLSSSARKYRLVCKLGKNLRFVLIFECETLCPVTGTFPVIKHTLDITQNFGRQRSGILLIHPSKSPDFYINYYKTDFYANFPPFLLLHLWMALNFLL